jgi:hypothetical protein
MENKIAPVAIYHGCETRRWRCLYSNGNVGINDFPISTRFPVYIWRYGSFLVHHGRFDHEIAPATQTGYGIAWHISSHGF